LISRCIKALVSIFWHSLLRIQEHRKEKISNSTRRRWDSYLHSENFWILLLTVLKWHFLVVNIQIWSSQKWFVLCLREWSFHKVSTIMRKRQIGLTQAILH
jgi:hypothetical protein